MSDEDFVVIDFVVISLGGVQNGFNCDVFEFVVVCDV